MTSKNETPLYTLTCKDCGAEVSGPDEKSVKETADRHKRGTGHG